MPIGVFMGEVRKHGALSRLRRRAGTRKAVSIQGKLCSRCGAEPAVPRQRWGSRCRAAAKREARRRAAGERAGNGAPTTEGERGRGAEHDPDSVAILETLIAAHRVLTTAEIAVAVGRPAVDVRPTLLDMASRGLVRRREMPWSRARHAPREAEGESS
jgi:hypothetical protein